MVLVIKVVATTVRLHVGPYELPLIMNLFGSTYSVLDKALYFSPLQQAESKVCVCSPEILHLLSSPQGFLKIMFIDPFLHHSFITKNLVITTQPLRSLFKIRVHSHKEELII